MKKTGKILLIVATVLVIVGLIGFVVTMANRDWNFGSMSTEEFETNTYTVSESFDKISIDVYTTDITFMFSEDERCSVECKETEKLRHNVSVQNGTLVINMTDTRKWYDKFGVFVGSYKMTVYLPEAEYASLKVDTDTGDVTMPEDFAFEKVNIDSDTGDVEWFATVSDTAIINLDTGDILVEKVTAENLELSSDTGSVELESVTAKGNIKADTDTGDIYLDDASCANLDAQSDTGDINLKNSVADGAFNIENETGDVEFENSDASEIFVDTSTGDITGTLRSDKIFQTDSETGRISVPDSVTGGKCKITSDTGDIELNIAS